MFLEQVVEILRSMLSPGIKTSLYYKTKSRALYALLGLTYKEFVVSFPQFFTWRYPISSFFRSLKYMLLAAIRLLMGRSSKISYSFQGEDRNIEGLLKPLITINGFYVDVGCNDPCFISNTFLFYRRGWRGICIDANESLIDKFQRIRPKDKSICSLVSNSIEPSSFLNLLIMFSLLLTRNTYPNI